MKNVVCSVSFLSEFLEGPCSYLSLSSMESFFARAANIKLLQDMGKCPAHFWKAALFPGTPVEQLGSRRSLGHSVPLLSFLFPLSTEVSLLANSVSVTAVNSSPCSMRL